MKENSQPQHSATFFREQIHAYHFRLDNFLVARGQGWGKAGTHSVYAGPKPSGNIWRRGRSGGWTSVEVLQGDLLHFPGVESWLKSVFPLKRAAPHQRDSYGFQNAAVVPSLWQMSKFI